MAKRAFGLIRARLPDMGATGWCAAFTAAVTAAAAYGLCRDGGLLP